MVSLDIIEQMQDQGMTDFEISKTLQSQGVSPREINEALNQVKIKSALSQGSGMSQISQNQQQPMQNQQPIISPMPQPSQPGMSTPTVLSDPVIQQQPMQNPQPSMMPVQPTNQYPVDNYAAQDPYMDQNANDGYYDEYYDDAYGDAESLSEIAEQVVNDKLREFTARTGDLVAFKNNVEDNIKSLNERLTRIENSIDKLQQSIIQKIGEFGENSAMIRRDLENLHNTTSKLMNPLIDNYRQLEKRK